MFTVPAPTAVITPVLLTVATDVLLEPQLLADALVNLPFES
jgi:hypothetical protein